MKIGVLVCAYNCAETVGECLAPWVAFVKENPNVEIGVISTVFKDFPQQGEQETMLALSDALCHTKAFVVSNPDGPLSEHDARNMPLHYFLENKFDVVWLLDADEFYTLEQIKTIAAMVEKQPLVTWWSVPFKNYVFDGKQWIDGFCPPRIFRTQVGNRKLKEFYWDNDVLYQSIDGNQEWDYKNLSNSRVPSSKAHVRHITWTHKNGKDKVAYQLKHFGHCSYRWNDEKNELEFDPEFYRKTGQPIPILLND